MDFEKIKALLESPKNSEKNRGFEFIYLSNRRNIIYHLRKSGCNDQEVALSLFNDSLMLFSKKLKLNEFEGNTLQSISAFLKRAVFFMWTKHPENPKKEEIKRGKRKDNQEIDSNLSTPSSKPSITNIDSLTNLERNKIVNLPDYSKNKNKSEKLSEKIRNIMKELSPDCQERIRRTKFYNPSPILASIPAHDVSISHKETAEDFQDSNEKASRKKLSNCKAKLKSLINSALTSDFELKNLIDDLLWN